MRDVKVKRAELLEKVKTNREKHVSEYREAVVGYKKAAKAEVTRAMQRLHHSIEELEVGDCVLQVPENHAKDYDQVIEMLKMCVDDEITVRADEFACYVMDDWGWKEEFLEVTGAYKK